MRTKSSRSNILFFSLCTVLVLFASINVFAKNHQTSDLYFFYINGKIGEGGEQRASSLGTPIPLHPTSDTTDTTPRFSWSNVTGAENYRLEVKQGSTLVYDPEPVTSSTFHTGAALTVDQCYTWRVRAESSQSSPGAWSNSQSFCVVPPIAQPTGMEPEGSTTDTTPLFDWDPVDNATYYNLQITRNGTQIEYIQHLSASQYQLSASQALTAGQCYEWRVRAHLNASEHGLWAEKQFCITSATPLPTPITLNPSGNTTDTTPRFSWSASSGAESYRLEVKQGSTLVYNPAPVTSSTFHIGAALNVDQCYSWRVRAESSQAPSSNWSTEKSFCIIPPIGQPNGLTPQGSITDTTPLFNWNPVDNATYYNLQISRNGTQVEYFQHLTNTQLQLSSNQALTAGQCYEWRVRAHLNASEHGLWAEKQICITSSTPLPTPVTLNPSGDTTDTTPRFSWSNSSGAESYRLEVKQGNTLVYNPMPITSATFHIGATLTVDQCYNWRVRAESSQAPSSNWSATKSFCIIPPIGQPNGLTPEGNITDTTPLLNWNSVDNATYYNLQIRQNGTQIAYIQHLAASQYQLAANQALTAGQCYEWSVRAHLNASEHGLWAEKQICVTSSTQLSTPILVSPTGNTADTTPRFSWSNSSGAETYEIEVTNDSTSSVVFQNTVTQTHVTSSTLPRDECYHWRVRAHSSLAPSSSWSTPEQFCVVDPISAPTGLTPQGTINDTTPNFSWDALANAEYYNLEILSGNQLLHKIQNITTNNYTLPAQKALSDGECYVWQVRGYLNYAEHGLWTQQSICVDESAAVLSVPLNLSPGGNITDTTPTFSWNPVSGAENYRLHVTQNSTLIYDPEPLPTTNTYTGSELTASGCYDWKVRAEASGMVPSDWSEIRTFCYEDSQSSNKTGEISPFTSSSNSLGITANAPYTSINEFTGKIQLDGPSVGEGLLQVAPHYIAPNRNYVEDGSASADIDIDGQLGVGWYLGYGYISIEAAYLTSENDTIHKLTSERVFYIDSTGNERPFYTDSHFTDDVLLNQFPGPVCAPGQTHSCVQHNRIRAFHYIDDRLNRITRDDADFGEGKYYLLFTNGSKITFEPSGRYNVTNRARYYPTIIEQSNGRKLYINYRYPLSSNNKPAISTVNDSWSRQLIFNYDYAGAYSNYVSSLSMKKGTETKTLVNFSYQQVANNQGKLNVHLRKISTPSGRSRIFDVELQGNDLYPFVTKLIVENGGQVDFDYSQVTLKERLPYERETCALLPPAVCQAGYLQTKTQTRIQKVSHSDGFYEFQYYQHDNGSDDHQFDVTVTGPEGYQRETQYRSPDLSDPGDDNLTIGKPLVKTETYDGESRTEEWEYGHLFGHGQVTTEGEENFKRSRLVTRYSTSEDGVWIDTTFNYKPYAGYFANQLENTARFVRGQESQGILRKFQYINRVTTNFEWNEQTKDDEYVLELMQLAEEQYPVGVSLRKSAFTYYTDKPLLKCNKQLRSSAVSINTGYTYFTAGENKGMIQTIATGDSSCIAPASSPYAVSYNDYVNGHASTIDYPLGPNETKTLDLMSNVTSHSRNGVTTSYLYDEDNRLTTTSNPAREDYLTLYNPQMVTTGFVIESKWENQPDKTVVQDKWGRDILVHQSIDEGVDMRTKTQYSALGLVESVSISDCPGALKFCARRTMTYDVYGRIKTTNVLNADSSILRQMEYDYVRLSNGHMKTINKQREGSTGAWVVKTKIVDLLGRVVFAATENDSTSFSYTRDSETGGIKRTINPSGGQPRTITYDWLGSTIRETHPEIEGNITYEYDERNLLKKVSGSGYKYHYQYDQLGRLIQKNCERNNSIQTCEKYEFDSSNRLILAEVFNTSETGSDWLKQHNELFDPMNKPVKVKLEIDIDGNGTSPTRSFTTTYGYNSLGQINTITYPNSSNKVDYQYSFNGAQKSVKWTSNKITKNVVDISFNPLGLISTLTYSDQTNTQGGNAVWSYDAIGRMLSSSLNLQQLSNDIEFKRASPEYSIANVTYNNHGSINSYTREDKLYTQPTDFSFGYSTTNELTSLTVGQHSINYNYDTYGNLTSRGELNTGLLTIPKLTTQYSSGNPYQNDSWTYNDEGQVTRDGMYEYSFNRLGRTHSIRAMSKSGNEQRYLYDSIGHRVATIKEDEVIYSVRDLDGTVLSEFKYQLANGIETQLQQNRKDFLYQNSRILLTSDADKGNETYYLDRLGSPAVTWSDSEVKHHEYSPYGMSMLSAPSHIGPGGYTGHEADSTGLTYMKARYQDPNFARFLVPDPARDFNPYNPGSYNLYQYTRNNPVNATDPTGLNPWLLLKVYDAADAVATFVDTAHTAYIRQKVYGDGGEWLMKEGLAKAGEKATEKLLFGSASNAVGLLKKGRKQFKKRNKNRRKVGDCSFTQDTEVLSIEGRKAFSKLKIGDLVYSRDESDNGTAGWRKILGIYSKEHEQVIHLTLENKIGMQEQITTTEEHPFYVENKGWVTADKLIVGHLLSSVNNTVLKVVDIQWENQPQFMWNIDVEDLDTYYVGELNTWVHNCEKDYPNLGATNIEIDDNGMAYVDIETMYAAEVGDFKELTEDLLDQGARKATIRTGDVVNEELRDRLDRALSSGKKFLGGTVEPDDETGGYIITTILD
ncbi:polymorphic toxin-type HINT domain-containing protein [Aliikangiella coralliicola]|uniref:Fibronectin type-III domain-containing protein n=1 Tax=Aliikangiella coralliicola TaxID=2592383 RepID=A0A545UIP6_9GAMM|nr:polymorphic toxin-type HINT domain-containing protein [Aliikangiella coralliicola]TQV89336.1 hypothetical protein FLL46_00180 [Aliikangiella coralliicola]